jgi:hypothetical protein
MKQELKTATQSFQILEERFKAVQEMEQISGLKIADVIKDTSLLECWFCPCVDRDRDCCVGGGGECAIAFYKFLFANDPRYFDESYVFKPDPERVKLYTEQRAKTAAETAGQATTRGTTSFFQEVLKNAVKGCAPYLDLIGMVYLDGLLTGYFINPENWRYVHIWQVRISPDFKIIYSDTTTEVSLAPIDGYKFRRDVILLKEEDELKNMGFCIPDWRNQ